MEVSVLARQEHLTTARDVIMKGNEFLSLKSGVFVLVVCFGCYVIWATFFEGSSLGQATCEAIVEIAIAIITIAIGRKIFMKKGNE